MSQLILIPSRLEWRFLLGETPRQEWGGYRVFRDGSRVWAICGIGPAASGISATELIALTQPSRVMLVGVGGAFPSSGLGPGDIVQAESETFVDLGHETDDRLVNLDQQGIAMLTMANREYQSHLHCEIIDQNQPHGPFATVSTVTSRVELANKIVRDYASVCENMEGAAVGHACRLKGIPFHEVRAISNMVGPRDRAAWQIEEPLRRLRIWLDERFES